MGAILAMVIGVQVAAFASHPLFPLAGSNFEIDQDANLKVDDSSPSIDWLTGGEATGFRDGVDWKLDTASGANDESFTQGTKEDTADPVVETGSIPPNKSDLKAFGLYEENDEFLELFWARVQDPSGTTNMDFELNQKVCEADGTNCAPTSKKTPVRTGDGTGPLQDDILITYDLSRGGTVATISIRKWNGTKWGPATQLANQTEAVGSINTSTIAASPLGSLSPRTFGEAAVSFDALFGEGQCGSFGSAYLKSRSSDSFTAALKDFVPPLPVEIGNCPAGLTTTAAGSDTPVAFGQPISDTAHLADVPTLAGGTITFHLWPTLADCNAGTKEIDTGLDPVTVSGPNDYNSGDFTPTAAGSYFWTAEYSGDDNPATDSAETACGDANETSVVANAPSTISTTQSWVPRDKALLDHTGGTVTFTLLKGVSLDVCEAGSYAATDVVYTSGPVNVTDTTAPIEVSTTDADAANQPSEVTANDTYRWKVVRSATGGFDAVSTCNETTTLNINNTGA